MSIRSSLYLSRAFITQVTRELSERNRVKRFMIEVQQGALEKSQRELVQLLANLAS